MIVGHAGVSVIGKKLSGKKIPLFTLLLFTYLPDIDIFLSLAALINNNYFWINLEKFHRGFSHSIIFSILVTLAVLITFLWFNNLKKESILITSILILMAVYILSKLSITDIFLLFSAIIISTLFTIREPHKETVFASIIALFTHPIGDMFTGEAPNLLYPVIHLKFDTIVLSSDPSVNFIIVFLAEIVLFYIVFWDKFNINTKINDKIAIISILPAILPILHYIIFPEPTLDKPIFFILFIIQSVILTIYVDLSIESFLYDVEKILLQDLIFRLFTYTTTFLAVSFLIYLTF